MGGAAGTLLGVLLLAELGPAVLEPNLEIKEEDRLEAATDYKACFGTLHARLKLKNSLIS